EEKINIDTAIKLVKGGIVNLEFFSMVDVSDVAEILEGDQESAEKICSAAKNIDLEGNNDVVAENENNDDNDQLERAEESVGSEVDEVEKESEGELESV
ncbi:MAG: hypothetical protein CMO37_04845, partial [Verrucomicrobiaceae bacterium]|nr:hypothetical protein [Verrucomicrobiaceae bacterium]